MLALFVVNNLGDLATVNGTLQVAVGSLRQAVELANANTEFDTIIFQDFLFDAPGANSLFLSADPMLGGPLLLTGEEGIQIIGPGPGKLTIHAGGNNRIFLVDDGSDTVTSSVTISGLGLADGNPLGDDEGGYGGAILNRESLTLREVEIKNNFAPNGGGGIYNETNLVSIERSLIRDNTSGLGGGGIQNGDASDTDKLPLTTIVNSTLTGNTAIGIPDMGDPTGYGGGILNSAGVVNIEQSTIYGNTASSGGGGSATQGFDPESDSAGAATVFVGYATTNIRSSIIVGNTRGLAKDDVGSVGMTDGEPSAMPPSPPAPFEPQINSLGYNLFGQLRHPTTSANPFVVLPPAGPGDAIVVDPTNVFIDNALGDYGGVLPVFMPDINKTITIPINPPTDPPTFVTFSPAIDRGDPFIFTGSNDQRGFQFVRRFGGRMDIGAAEVQLGNFTVNTLVDEIDGRYSNVPTSVGTFPLNFLSFVPDFSIREALEFGQKNLASGLSGVGTVGFSSSLLTEDDPTLGTPAPTILLSLGELLVDFDVIIQGPAFDLEIDASGSGSGSRIFNITASVEINNLILRGGDHSEFGGGIFTSADLTLRNSTLLDNTTSGSGGALYVDSGTVLVEGTTIHSNVASFDGGGIYVASGDVTVNNSTISGNTGARGGGIANADGNLLVRYSTITLNTASSLLGSGVASFRDASATTSIRSSIIADNAAFTTDVDHIKSGTNSIVSLGYNLVGNGNAVVDGVFNMSGDQTFTDPMLAPLARLGGPTPVHRLLPGSPAIDMGAASSFGLGNVPTYDQRGFPFDRIESGSRIDIGAFETQDDVFLVGDGSAAEGSYVSFVDALADSNLTPTKETIVFLDTWPGEFFPGGLLEITDSVDILGQGFPGLRFFGLPQLTIVIDDGNGSSLLDVSIDSIRMEDNTNIVSRENLTLTNMQFVNNTTAVSQTNGKLTISDSTFIGNSERAIRVVSGDLEINNSFLSGNSTSGDGGAIYIRDGDFTANYLYITGNTAPGATGKGGGIYGRDSTMTLTNAIISGNSTTGSNSEGGGLAAKDSDITLIDSVVTFNTTSGSQSRGGGIFVDGGSLDIQNSNLSLNQTYGQYSSGGAISSVNADLTITGTTVGSNEVSGIDTHGGGIHAIGGDLTIRDSTVFNNMASATGSKGGGIYSDTNLAGTQTALIFNSTISGNTATLRGGGVYHADGLLKIQYSTITDNSVPYFGNGGGVASYGNSGTTRTEVRSSIIAGNFSTNDSANPNSDVESVVGLTNSFVSQGYNVIGKGVALALNAFNQVGDQTNVVDPGLGALTLANGGSTATHALLIASPAINAGDPSAVADVGNVPLNDQRGTGFSRVINSRIDVGAFESNLAPLGTFAPTDFNNDGVVSGSDFLLWQIGFGKPNATKSDGDSNGDMIVNTIDLDNWELAYGTSGLLSASQTSSAPLAETTAVATETSLAGDGNTTELSTSQSVSAPISRNAAQGNVFLVMGLTQASPELSPPETAIQESETAAIDQSMAEYSPISGSSGSTEESIDFGDIAVSRQVTEDASDSEDEFLVEDAAFAALGEGW